ncbi:unnamed protein product [Blepharisma stoltei]|uniref:Uncharacterized protein n=1 Tax=Blepharisma stoltei TaxID=1481888 RepID=A0AAU9K702_9CILI|nr:unnamed protein product [Blepharisma stoltei]
MKTIFWYDEYATSQKMNFYWNAFKKILGIIMLLQKKTLPLQKLMWSRIHLCTLDLYTMKEKFILFEGNFLIRNLDFQIRSILERIEARNFAPCQIG